MRAARKSSTFSFVTMVTGTEMFFSTVPPPVIVTSASTAAAPMPAGSCWITAST